MGDIYQWRGGDGAFGDQAQWDDLTAGEFPAQQPPGASDETIFNSSGTVSGNDGVLSVTISRAAVTFTGVISPTTFTADDSAVVEVTYRLGGNQVDIGESSRATVTIDSGAGLSANTIVLGDQVGAAGSLAVVGPLIPFGPISVVFQSTLIVGNAGAGFLSVTQGAAVQGSPFPPEALEIGAQSSGTGTITVSGSGSAGGAPSLGSSLVAAFLAVGGTDTAAGGSGLLSISTGAQVQGFTTTVWSSGTITLDGGTLASGNLTVDGTLSGFGSAGGAAVNNGFVAAEGGTLSLGGSSSGFVNNGSLVAENGSLILSPSSSASSDVVNNGVIAAKNGTLDLMASTGHTSSGVVNNGTLAVEDGTLIVSGSLGGSGTLAFDGVATLVLRSPGTGIAAPVRGLFDGDRIELGNRNISGAQVTSPGTLTITTAQGDYVLSDVSFAPGSQQFFVPGHDAATGDDFIQVACFATGTRIAVSRGDVAVEHLRVGDLVTCARTGRASPIVWMGFRHVDCARHPAPSKVQPVSIRAHAFGPGQPSRTLLLSPDHAVFVDGVLIPVKYLIDDDAIAQLCLESVTYFHLELPQHDVLLAEGLPVESYLPGEDRSDFANGGGAMRLHPDFAVRQWEAYGCVPLVVTGPKLEAARRLIASTDLEHPLHFHRRVSR